MKLKSIERTFSDRETVFSGFKAKIRCLLLLVVLASFSVAAVAQQRNVTGVVSDNFGEPIPGVQVIIQGTTTGAITNLNGEFTITVPGNEAVLVFTFMGLNTLEVEVGDRSILNITMQEDEELLGEVVVTAFGGTQRRESITAAITSVDPRQLRVPSSNLTTAFAGQVAGVIAYQLTGEPGFDNAEFFVRGVTTFGTGMAGPLILIDHVELSASDLARLHPDDIASFVVLKDAAATAMYGARGANGVILVTTREGREGPVRVNARFENSISAPTRRVQVADPLTFMRLHNEAVITRNPEGAIPYSESSIFAREQGRNPYVFPMVDWMDKMFKPFTMNQRGNISLSGGGTVARYMVSLNYSRDTGILNVPALHDFNNNIRVNRYGVRSNVNLRLARATELSIRVSGAFDDFSGPITGGSELFRRALRANPVRFPAIFQPDADEAHAHITFPMFGNFGDRGTYYNPYADMLRGFRQSQTTSVIAQLELREDLDRFVPGLRWRAMISTTRNSNFDVTRSFRPHFFAVSSYDPLADTFTLGHLNPSLPGLPGGTDWLEFFPGTNRINSTLYGETTLQYDRTFGIHNVSGMLVYSMSERVENNAQPTIVDGVVINTRLHNSMPRRNIGFASRISYNLLNRYIIDFTAGYNASERFDRAFRWGFFPTVSAGWRISNEPFYEGTALSNVMNLFHIRASHGQVGNDDIGAARFFHLSAVEMVGGGHWFGTDFNWNPGGVTIGRYANPAVGWEVAHSTNLGIETQFFTTLNLRANYFTERRTGVLQPRADLPTTMGLVRIPEANVGEARGQGFDISLDFMHSFNQDFWVTARGTFTYATSWFSRVEEPDFSETPWRSRVGLSLAQRHGFIAERLFIDEHDVFNSPQQFGTVMAGDIKFMDINGDGIIDNRDMVPIGFPTRPEIIYGFGVSSGFRNFDLSVFFQGSARSSFWIDAYQIAPFVNTSPGTGTTAGTAGNNAVLQFIADDHWSEANQNPYAAWPRLSPVRVDNNQRTSTWFMRNGAFLRIASAEFGYTLPEDLVSRARLSSARIYLSGTNLFTFSSFRLWDIEMRGNGLAYPIQRVVNLGLQVSI